MQQKDTFYHMHLLKDHQLNWWWNFKVPIPASNATDFLRYAYHHTFMEEKITKILVISKQSQSLMEIQLKPAV